MNRIRIVLIAFITVLIAACTNYSSSALEEDQLNIFAQNDILFYDPGECEDSGSNLSVCGTNLPSETIEMLKNANVKENAEKNMERYKYAEKETGLSWQIVAALHFREGGMSSDQSILNGEKLYDHTNVDGQHVSADANEDAKNAAKHFIDMAKSVYKKDVLNDQSMDSLGYGFLAYNRGYMYKCNGNVSYKKSPYVMNFYDDDHMHMTWISADSLDCNGNSLNSVAGKKNEQVGALAVLAYLCGEENSSSSSSSKTSSKSDIGQSIADKAKELAWSEKDKSKSKSPTDAFTKAAKSAGTDGTDDCLTFVKTVVISSGADANYPAGSSAKETDLVKYMNSSDKWNKINTTKESDLLPGDILVSAVKGYGNNHIFIYLGNNKAASANLGQWYGRIENLKDEWWNGGKPFYYGDNKYQVFRVNSSSSCASGKFVWYGQCESKWANSPFGTSTVCAAGCGPTSFAMMASMLLGKEITPTEAAKVAGDGGMYVAGAGSSHAITKFLADHYGLEYKKLPASSTSEAVSTINKYLKEGWMMHVSGSGSTPFTSGGHYIGIRGIANDGNWLLADSGHSEADSTTRTWKPISVVTSGMNLSNINAIRASSTSTDCGNICPDDGGTTSTNGFSSTKDAQFIIDAYKKDDLSKYSLSMPPSGDYHDNCVAFSLWFINHFTKISYPGGLTGNGNQFVDYFYNKFKSKYPDLKITNTPSVYSVASWSVAVPAASSGNHTGIVIGIDEANDKILIAEAGWDQPSFTGIHEYQLSPFKGSGKKYINLNKYLKSNTGLK